MRQWDFLRRLLGQTTQGIRNEEQRRGPHAKPSADYSSLLPSAREAASFTNGGAELIQSPSLGQRRPIAIKSTFFIKE